MFGYPNCGGVFDGKYDHIRYPTRVDVKIITIIRANV